MYSYVTSLPIIKYPLTIKNKGIDIPENEKRSNEIGFVSLSNINAVCNVITPSIAIIFTKSML
jgi:hypothetical protein